MTLYAYLPQDCLLAFARGETLPDRAHGSALFADISGFTPPGNLLPCRLHKIRKSQLFDETLTQEEHGELLDLVDIIEKADADRLKRRIELARLRNTTLDPLVDQLGIHRTVYA